MSSPPAEDFNPGEPVGTDGKRTISQKHVGQRIPKEVMRKIERKDAGTE
jgi:hypothetical protein